jgi:hypothetical protein
VFTELIVFLLRSHIPCRLCRSCCLDLSVCFPCLYSPSRSLSIGSGRKSAPSGRRSPRFTEREDSSSGNDDDSDVYCELCHIYSKASLKVKHCNDCGYCIEKLDHHCPWMGQCVGRYNMM